MSSAGSVITVTEAGEIFSVLALKKQNKQKKTMIRRNLKNVLVVSFGFLSLFTAYEGLQSLQVIRTFPVHTCVCRCVYSTK